MIMANNDRETLYVKSEITGTDYPSTINMGILLDSGERIGATADIDEFAAFCLKLPCGRNLWQVFVNRPDTAFDRSKGCKRELEDSAARPTDDDRESRIALYSSLASAGLPMFGDE